MNTSRTLRTQRFSRKPVWLLYALPLCFLLAFYVYPLAAILRLSFADLRGADVTALAGFFTDSYFWQLLWFTTWQAAVSTMLTLIAGLPLAYLFSHYTFPGKSLLSALTAIPFVMPTVVVAAAFTTLLGQRGLLNRGLMELFGLASPPLQIENTIWMILLAHVFFNVSVIIRAVGGFWANLNPRLQEAAAVLGANPRRVFTQITLPLLMPSILAASLLVFLFCFTSFGVILILGGLRFATLEVEIYRQSVSLFNLPVAALLALIQLLLTLTVTAVYTRLQARSALPIDLRPHTATARTPATRREGCLVALVLLLAVGALLAPLLALAWQSVTLGAAGFTLRYYQELTINRRQSAFFVPPLAAIRNSLTYATQTVILSVTLGLISAYLLAPRRGSPGARRAAILDPLFLLPLGTSAVTLGFGYILALGSLRASTVLVPIAHTLIAMPFVVRTVLPALRGLDPHWRESAAVLGASSPCTWYAIDLPLLARTILVAAAFAFTISLGEFGATLLISRPDHPTMPIAIYAALSRPGLLNYGQAVAMSTLLMLICALGLIFIERLRFGTIGEF